MDENEGYIPPSRGSKILKGIGIFICMFFLGFAYTKYQPEYSEKVTVTYKYENLIPDNTYAIEVSVKLKNKSTATSKFEFTPKSTSGTYSYETKYTYSDLGLKNGEDVSDYVTFVIVNTEDE